MRVRGGEFLPLVTARKSLIFAAVHFYSIVKFALDCFVAFAPRNGMKLVVSLPNPNHFPSPLEKLSPRPLGEREEFLGELCELRNSGEGSLESPYQHPS